MELRKKIAGQLIFEPAMDIPWKLNTLPFFFDKNIKQLRPKKYTSK